MNQVISFSGGKDSTAMLLEMLERGEKIHSVVAFDTGWEFPQMLEHWDAVEEYTGIEIVRVYPNYDFTESLFTREIKMRDGSTRKGNGWATPVRRWCTREKLNAIDRHMRTIPDVVSCIGFASDEAKRAEGATVNNKPWVVRYPLIEWGIDEARALEICKAHGFNWGGLYDHFMRVSCFCCPLKPLPELRTLRREFPDLWQTMLDWDGRCTGYNPGFYGYESVQDMEDRFSEEDRLGDAFNIRAYNREKRAK